ncbi:hypothetical protein DEIPH_ctg041orf0017 [Deinococcus phoenicis]|uniref:Uncharacterized protein n=1 Tax=Deinococcus phoenicis TaxID=1476583 RepID=A0A016QNR8_9DEIO|nr:hypothetical protein [Deinococcus phoenicis]EYB67419.1 hypothetical protein DEIPH_ctg041orf0017 [Deinococcus phoenicis]
MNITAGKGGQAWRPARLFFEAHDAPPFGVPDETFGAAAITVQLSYGPLGTLRSGNIGMSEVPATWAGQAWPRMIRVQLESELGTGYIAAGIAEAATVRQGELSDIPLVGLETTYLGRPGDSSAALNGAGFTPGGARAFGVPMPAPDGTKTRQQAVDDALEPYPNAEAGVTADLTGVIGRPESATPAVYTLDSRAYGLRSLGWTVTDYVTDATYQAGPEWPLHTYSRSDVPPLAPRRSAVITLDPMTETVEEVTAATTVGGIDVMVPVEGLDAGHTWIVRLGYPVDVGQRPVERGPLRALALRLNFTAERRTPDPVNLTLRIKRANGTDFFLPATPVTLSGVGSYTYTLPPELWGPDARASGGWVQDVWVYLGGSYPAGTAPANRNSLALNSAQLVASREYERSRNVVMPPGWMPYAVGPTWEFTLPGVHVPPLRVDGLPGGLSQHVAGAVVTWDQGEASTRLLTAALPYRGQRRRA